ncbi:hypothetical protein [Clostridium guangxiense]|uniref:hypothetical protein n=1 Tax=Clostridium guangxiense TaxID=1662055 RepID=UPI001E53E0FF|nr:hypothetical protein [Clostridium guangxiense]MCD2345827.1 hypothetical protein [Clostridium guangxiense]
MSNNTLYLTIGGSVGVIAIIILAGYLKYKGVNILGFVQKLKSIFTTAETYTKAAEGLTEGKANQILQAADVFEKLGIEGATYAEQMLLSMQIQNDTDGSQRRELAQKYIYAFLQAHGIAITDDIKTIVQGIVEKTVLSDKTIEEINKKIDDLINTKVAALQSEVSSLADTNTKLTAENQTLNEKLANVAAQMK